MVELLGTGWFSSSAGAYWTCSGGTTRGAQKGRQAVLAPEFHAGATYAGRCSPHDNRIRRQRASDKLASRTDELGAAEVADVLCTWGGICSGEQDKRHSQLWISTARVAWRPGNPGSEAPPPHQLPAKPRPHCALTGGGSPAHS